MRLVMTMALGASIMAGAASAKPALRDVAEIDDRLFEIAIANEIDKNCAEIKGRRFKAINIMWALRSRANDLGYTDTEIRAYIESDSEKDRMRKKGKAYLKTNGAVYGDPKSFCALGRAEIQKPSQIGALLRAK